MKIIKNGPKSQWSAPNLPDGRSSNIPKHVKNLYIIYIIYIINKFIYLYIYLWFLEWARGVFLRDFSQKRALFWSFLMIFDFRWPPRTTPMPWINSFYFIGLSSSRWTTFLLVWYMSEVILGVKSQLRKSESIWNLEIASVGSLCTGSSNFKSTHFCEVAIWP